MGAGGSWGWGETWEGGKEATLQVENAGPPPKRTPTAQICRAPDPLPGHCQETREQSHVGSCEKHELLAHLAQGSAPSHSSCAAPGKSLMLFHTSHFLYENTRVTLVSSQRAVRRMTGGGFICPWHRVSPQQTLSRELGWDFFASPGLTPREEGIMSV